MFKDIFDFCQKIDLSLVNSKKLESLILAGAFDYTHETRATLLQTVDTILAYRKEYNAYESTLNTYRKKLEAYEQREEEIQQGKTNEKGKVLKALKKPELPMAPKKPSYIRAPEFSKLELLQQEKELTGSFISGHPLDGIKVRNVITINQLKTDPTQPSFAKLLVVFTGVEVRETKKNKTRMASLNIEDTTGVCEGVVFPRIYKTHEDLLIKNFPLIIGARVAYLDVEEDNEDQSGQLTSMVNLQIQTIERAQVFQGSQDEPIIDLNLTLDNIATLHKYAGQGEEKVRFQFITESQTKIFPNQIISVKNERELRTQIHRKCS